MSIADAFPLKQSLLAFRFSSEGLGTGLTGTVASKHHCCVNAPIEWPPAYRTDFNSIVRFQTRSFSCVNQASASRDRASIVCRSMSLSAENKRNCYYSGDLDMHLTVKSAVADLFGLAAIVSASQGVFSIRDLSEIRQNVSDIGAKRLPAVDTINRINTAMRDYRVKLYRFVVASNSPADFAVNTKTLAAAADAIVQLRGEYEPMISSPEEKAIYGQFSTAWAQDLKEQQLVLDAMVGDRKAEALATLTKPELAQLNKDAADALQKGGGLNKQAAEAAVSAGLASADAATRTAYIAWLSLRWPRSVRLSSACLASRGPSNA